MRRRSVRRRTPRPMQARWPRKGRKSDTRTSKYSSATALKSPPTCLKEEEGEDDACQAVIVVEEED